MAQNITAQRGSAIDARTSRHPGYEASATVRRRIEGIFGWMKTTGGLRKTRYIGREKTDLMALMTGAAYNLLRMSRLIGGG